jgi:hypothetical protein
MLVATVFSFSGSPRSFSNLISRRHRSYDPGIAVSASYVSRVRP